MGSKKSPSNQCSALFAGADRVNTLDDLQVSWLVSGLLSVSSANTVSQACKAPNGLVPALTPLDVRTGMLYCNLPHMQAKQGDRVRLHLFSLGTENGIHAPSVSASTLDWEARTFPPRSLLCKTRCLLLG